MFWKGLSVLHLSMRTLLLTSLLLLTALVGRGQDFDFAPEGAIWTYYRTNIGEVDASPMFYALGDTIIDGKTCRKMLTPHAGVIRFYYYVNKIEKKVYRWDETSGSFFLEIDFSVSEGDTFYRKLRINEDCIEDIGFKIEKIDSINFNGEKHAFYHTEILLPNNICQFNENYGYYSRRWCINELEESEHYKAATYSTLFGYSVLLIPIKSNPNANYGIATFKNGDILYNANCKYGYTSVEPKSIEAINILYSHNMITCHGKAPIRDILMTNSIGQTIMAINSIYKQSYSLDVSHLSKGVYFLYIDGFFKKILMY
jgi:hypothetical protein